MCACVYVCVRVCVRACVCLRDGVCVRDCACMRDCAKEWRSSKTELRAGQTNRRQSKGQRYRVKDIESEGEGESGHVHLRTTTRTLRNADDEQKELDPKRWRQIHLRVLMSACVPVHPCLCMD